MRRKPLALVRLGTFALALASGAGLIATPGDELSTVIGAAREAGTRASWVAGFGRARAAAANLDLADPRAVQALEELAELAAQRGWAEPALELYAEALERRADVGLPALATAEAMARQAAVLERLGRLDQAELLLRSAVTRTGARQAPASVLRGLVSVIRRLRPQDAELETLARQVVDRGASDRAYFELARVYRAHERTDEAIAALGMTVELAGPDSTPWPLFEALIELADAQAEAGRPDAAREHYQRALELQEGYYGPQHPGLAETLRRLGGLHLQRDELDLAEPVLERAYAMKQRAWAECHACTREVGALLDRVKQSLGHASDPCWTGDDAPRPAPESAPPDSTLASSDAEREARRQERQLDLAGAAGRRSVQIAERLHGAHSVELALRLERLASILLQQQFRDEAETAYRRALVILDAQAGAAPTLRADTLDGLGRIAEAEGRHADAERWYLREAADRALGGQPLRVAALYELLGRVLRAGQEPRRSGEYFQRAADLWGEIAGPAAPETLRAGAELVGAYIDLGLYADAEAALGRLTDRMAQRGGTPRHVRLVVLRAAERLYAATRRPDRAARASEELRRISAGG